MEFNTYPLKDEILKAIDEMGFEKMTPIQEQALPIALEGGDMIGQAQTGTGKTTAFSLPILQNIEDNDQIQALILTPTRELCIQVEKEIHRLAKYLRIRSLAVYGGQEIDRQIRALKNRPQIIVATPGRLMDHMRRRTIRLDALRTVVLDEADEMLNMGFLEDIETILAACPEERQSLMFSATMRPEIEKIARTYMKNPTLVRIKAEALTVPAVEQEAYIIYEEKKLRLLTRLLEMMAPDLAMVFGRTKRRVDELTRALQTLGFQAEGLHGDLSQYQRDQVMRKFRERRIQILVATDVAARGIDIEGVTHVFNFDLPQDADSYVHRIGRTGRAGHEGLAINFVTPREKRHLSYIEHSTKAKIQRMPLPTASDREERQRDRLMNRVRHAMRDEAGTGYYDLAAALLTDGEPEDILAAALSLIGEGGAREIEAKKIELTFERPIYSKEPPRKNGRSRHGNDRYKNGKFGRPSQNKRKKPYGRKPEKSAKGKRGDER